MGPLESSSINCEQMLSIPEMLLLNGLCLYAKRPLMSRVAVIPKEGRA